MVDLATAARGNLSPVGAGFNLVNTIIGSGILALPYALREAGFYLGLAVMVLVALLSYAALNTLIHSGRRVGLYRFEDVSAAALGRPGHYLLSFALLVNSVGSCISYLIIVGDTATPIAQNLFGAGPLTSRQAVIALAAVGCTLPLLFFRTLEPLVRASVASTACLPFIVAIVAVRGPAYRTSPEPVPMPVFGPSVLPAFGIIAFAYSCTQTAFQSYLTLRHRTMSGWRRAAAFANGLALAIYLAFAITSYRSFGMLTEPNVLNNFAHDDALANLARMLLAFSLTLTYPMQFYPIRDLLGESLALAPGGRRVGIHALTLALFASTLAAALAVSDLGFVFKLVGTAASSLLLFGLPGIVYLRLVSPYLSSKTAQAPAGEGTALLDLAHPSGDDDIAEPHTSLVSVLLLAVGAAVFVIGTCTSIREAVSSSK
ncbi:hypothetical protein LPJ61_004473 [Coemansia biformis]|uniref:Amino acid transporter transmembrane domain-containing protein n=1 Tax=Coemansia biformis TaxID=1286918 RepID=A0A9W7Y4R8_9FUNG|nr:hypothetical protein LPJ61_004473 [Coemansia biformis]